MWWSPSWFPTTHASGIPDLQQEDSRRDNHCRCRYVRAFRSVFDAKLSLLHFNLLHLQYFASSTSKKHQEHTTAHVVPPSTTFVAKQQTGHETLVRFSNKISTNVFKTHVPCTGNRSGRPFATHLHGSASLAPFDGWADDETCVEVFLLRFAICMKRAVFRQGISYALLSK